MAETYEFGSKILRETVGIELDYRRISRSSDQSFWGHGVPTLFASLSEQPLDDSPTGAALAQLLGAGGKSGGLGWWWHTTEDTIDKIDPSNLVRDAGVYAETLWQLCTVRHLPINPAAAAMEIARTLAEYQTDAGGSFDLGRTEALAREAATAIAAFSRSKRDPERSNALTMALCHALIPVNYTQKGPFDQDLALRVQPLPGLSDVGALATLRQGTDEYFFLRTRLVRERNRVEHALRRALSIVERS
jgi:hypothetical protein